MIGVDEVLICLLAGGELLVIRRSDAGFEPIARYRVADSSTWASPAIVNGHILVKDTSHLTLWRVE